ncbi:MAG: 3-mercaptopyruvate sulfurtransferase [Rhodobacterales bacterium]|nr:3-mercaptopyruvate sulfurtransferase [Pseudomonadota bacterium]MDA1285930.1 3-mercaptopyruvate sulfurtransferase [Pseudomonadota bacterium]
MPNSNPTTLVSTDWLARHLGSPDIRIIDASWYLPQAARDPKAEYDAAHIPGARFFDIDDISDSLSDLPHMAPPPEKFISRMRAMGIGDGHQVVIYDGAGLNSAARVWWLFHLFGKTDTAVLDGGLPKWLAEGRATEDMPPVLRDRHMTVVRNAQLIKDVTQVAAASKLKEAQIVDARSAARFAGEAPEPRAGLRSGHIPNSISLPFTELLNSDGTMKSDAELALIMAAKGIDMKAPVITTCGSGVTAAIINLALARLGHKQHSLYDGSWAEWGMYNDLKVAKG